MNFSVGSTLMMFSRALYKCSSVSPIKPVVPKSVFVPARFGSTRGTVKWFNNDKGYGFVTKEDGGDVFVHVTGINGRGFKTLFDGDLVSFDVISGTRGYIAVDLDIISPNNSPLISSRRKFYLSQAQNKFRRFGHDNNQDNNETNNAPNNEDNTQSL